MMYKIKIMCVESNNYMMTYSSYDSRNTKYNELKEALRVSSQGVIEYDDGFVRIPMIIGIEKVG